MASRTDAVAYKDWLLSFRDDSRSAMIGGWYSEFQGRARQSSPRWPFRIRTRSTRIPSWNELLLKNSWWKRASKGISKTLNMRFKVVATRSNNIELRGRREEELPFLERASDHDLVDGQHIQVPCCA
ncbi:hypothetical protein MMC28_009355 [Mycoblastus sanguinarius]|nr:hypothetical protein [Mycoblastus sanguinarius]